MKHSWLILAGKDSLTHFFLDRGMSPTLDSRLQIEKEFLEQHFIQIKVEDDDFYGIFDF